MNITQTGNSNDTKIRSPESYKNNKRNVGTKGISRELGIGRETGVNKARFMFDM